MVGEQEASIYAHIETYSENLTIAMDGKSEEVGKNSRHTTLKVLTFRHVNKLG